MHNILELPLSKWYWINVFPLYAIQNKFSQLIYNWLLYSMSQGNAKKVCLYVYCYCISVVWLNQASQESKGKHMLIAVMSEALLVWMLPEA